MVVDMGRVRFDSAEIPVSGPWRDVLRESLVVGGRALEFSAATVSNRYCVVLRQEVPPDEARELGPLIERDPRFPRRTNVQFVQVLDRRNIRIEVWERGAGYTPASGSSSCAAVARRLELCDSPITVLMSGGSLAVEIDAEFRARMTGPVSRWQ